MKELLEKRSYTAKHFQKEDGSFVMQGHQGHIHYKNEDGDFEESVIQLEDKGEYWEMTKHNYHLRVIKDFSAPSLIEFVNKYEEANHTIQYDPRELAWFKSEDFSDLVVFRTQQKVTGVYDKEKGIVRYTNAFGDGIHFEITLMRSGFKKEVVIDSREKIGDAPTPDHKLIALFRYRGSNLELYDEKNDLWDSETFFESQAGFAFSEKENPFATSFIRPAYVLQNNEDGLEVPTLIKVFWKKEGADLVQAKVLPLDFLDNAKYPIRADTVTSYYAGAGDGWLAYNLGGASWSTARNASTAITGAFPTDATNWGMVAHGTAYLYRAVFQIDTSALGAGAVISSATMYFKLFSSYLNTGSIVAHLAPITTASNTTLSASDYGNVTFTDLGSSPWSGASVGNYFGIALNSTGLTNINKTGFTKLAQISGGDLNNVAPSAHTNGSNIYYSEASGTGNDPYIEITYTSGTTVSASVESSASSTPAPTVSGGALITPAVNQSASSVPTPTVTGGAVVTADASTSIISNPTPDVLAGGIRVTADVSSSASSVPTSTILLPAEVTAGVNEGSSSTPSPTLLLGITITPDPVSVVASIPDVRVDADFWNETYESNDASIWSDKY